MNHQQLVDLVSGVLIALVMFALAWVTAVAPEDVNPSRSPALAAMRSRRGRYVIAALMAAFGLVILILHIIKFAAE